MALRLAGPGAAWATPASGVTPVNFGKAKELSISIDASAKGLTGGFKAPIDFMGGEWKIAGKLKMAELSPLLVASLVMGVSPATGSTLTQFMEPGAIPGSSTYVVTVANGATFTGELEVLNALTGLPFVKVPSAPSAGQYSVASGGAFTFAAADAGKGVLFSYNYTAVGGFNLAWMNQLQGDIPIFGLTFYNKKNGYPINYTVPFVCAPKLNRVFKENDFMNPELDVMIGANAAGQIMFENYPVMA